MRHGNSMFGMKKKINLSHLNQHMTKCGPEGEGNNVTKFVVLLNHKPNPKKILLLEQGWVQWVFALFYGFNPCCADPSMTQLSGTAAVCWISFWSFCWVRCQWKGLGVWAALSLWVSLRLAQTGLCVSTGSPQGCELWDCVQGCRVLPACSGFPQRRGWCDVMWFIPPPWDLHLYQRAPAWQMFNSVLLPPAGAMCSKYTLYLC